MFRQRDESIFSVCRNLLRDEVVDNKSETECGKASLLFMCGVGLGGTSCVAFDSRVFLPSYPLSSPPYPPPFSFIPPLYICGAFV